MALVSPSESSPLGEGVSRLMFQCLPRIPRVSEDCGAGRCSVLSQSCPLFATMWTLARLLCPCGFSRQESGVGCHALLQGIFPAQQSIPGLLHHGQILYPLSHQGSPWKLEWAASPFSRGSSQPRYRTRVSCIAGGFFTNWATRKAQRKYQIRLLRNNRA